ncbi:P-loop NTPase fold protein [Acinetobacter courvalinii]|uniref:P-loop NTPase fold protein n=1 Tax=Acinetobacter courvalinii TaxID=280147 RepID=UPI0019005A5F|nr:P-loop NTPase fold protein [Acinetobacter courvalinii]MBJ8418185.1 KAP family P-loop domain protein [Acinetobacter courvalinii]
MNVSEQEKRLKDLLEHNSKNEKVGTAIAITGPWGVGKTFFWNKFLKEITHKEINDKKSFYYEASRFNYESTFDCKKYAYISLFGIENLSDLKNIICAKLSLNPHVKSNNNKFEFLQLVKNVAAQFRDMKVSQYGVSASAKILESLLFLQVKDAIICFDDFERMSSKLDIHDVMGLANYLKLEKNCQIILILDEEKAEADNKRKYAEYKEKLVDETIIINSVEPLIRENTKDFDEPLIELMIEFSETLGIHNFRFFQKVINLYQQFRNKLSIDIALSTKEIILIRILQGFFVIDFGGKYEISWDDFTTKNLVRNLINEKNHSDNDKSENIILGKLKNVSYLFIKDDLWSIEFRKWFNQVGELDFILLNDLANSTLISEENNKIKESFHKGCEDFWGLKVDKEFPEIFYEKTRRVIGLERLGNLSFALKILDLFEKDVTALEQDIINWMAEEMEKDISIFRLDGSFGEVRPIFKQFIGNYKLDVEKLPNLIDAIFNIHVKQEWSKKDELAMKKASKEDWEKILFEEISLDSRFNSINSSYVIKKVLARENASELGMKIRNLITEIYNEKAQSDQFYKNYMNFLISRFDN